MIEDVRHHLTAGLFEPFSIVTSSGPRYEIPSAGHAGVNPRGNRIVIGFDDGGSVTLSALHITAVEKLARKNGHAWSRHRKDTPCSRRSVPSALTVSPVTSKRASWGRIKTSHSEQLV